MYRLGIDTGGTFTDVVAIDETSGEIITTKTPSTPDDPSRGLLDGVDKVLRGRGARPSGIFHGTTVATNALLEEREAGSDALGLITTQGFRHVLEIARQSVPEGYGNSYFWVKPPRIVPLHLVREVSERLDYRGNVLVPLDEAETRQVARCFRERGIRSIAVCLIHAYANGDHERQVAAIIAEEHPEASVSLSSDVLPEYREYERTITTVIDAFVKPSVQAYVERAAGQVRTLSNGGPEIPFLIMQSNGGVLSAVEVARQPITTLLSGPAAGALGASWLAGLAGYPNVLTVDAGGTSTDICVVDGGAPHVTTEGRVGRFPVKVPMIDIITIGTGGGSIAWTDNSGNLRVGPRSAGAAPGPMCYGAGGDEPTLTDANVLLGRLPPHLLGGEVPLDVERARFGLAQLAARLEMDPVRLAAGIVEIADWKAVNAIRQVTVKKGLDPRDYAMVAFGGSGPLQAGRVAELLELHTTIIPPNPGNVSALGLLAVDLKADYVATVVQRQDRFDATSIANAYQRLQERAARDLERQGVPAERRRYLRSADLRYFGQAYEVRVEIPAGDVDDATLSAAVGRFHAAHERLYGYSYRQGQLVELVNVRVIGVGLIDRPNVARSVPPLETCTGPAGVRPVYMEGFVACPIYDRASLLSGDAVNGPAIVEEYGSTTVVGPRQAVKVDGYGNLLLRPAEGGGRIP